MPVCVLSRFSCVRLFVSRWTCSLPGSSVHGILQARILEWVAMPFSRGSSWPRDWKSLWGLLHWQEGSLPLVPPGNSKLVLFAFFCLLLRLNIFPCLSIKYPLLETVFISFVYFFLFFLLIHITRSPALQADSLSAELPGKPLSHISLLLIQ